MKKRLITIGIVLCSMIVTIKAQNMNTVSFNGQQATAVTAIACHEARGDQSSLAVALNEAFEAGLTVNQAKEILSHLYAYTGFPRSLNALGTLQRVVADRTAQGKIPTEGKDSSPLPSDYDALKQGTEVQTQLTGVPFNYTFCPAEDYYLKAHLFGDIFAHDVLTHADRELVTVSALSGLEGVMPQHTSHVRGALNMGVTQEQLQGIVSALRAHRLEAEALRCEAAIAGAKGQQVPVISPSAWPIGEPNTAFAQYFIGNSYLAILNDKGLCNVTFEPCCRNNWHIHHDAVQVLVCVNGRGWYQEWGKQPVELKEGTVVTVPAGTKHWHGAAADSWMQHLASYADMKPTYRTEWLEPVNDEEYSKLK